MDFVDLMGIYRFRVSGGVSSLKRTAPRYRHVPSLVDEQDNLSADRNPNPLPLRRAVADILEDVRRSRCCWFVENPNSKNQYGDHALQVL